MVKLDMFSSIKGESFSEHYQSGLGTSVIVLAGGHSKRFGKDKALFQINGISLLQRVINVANHLSDDVLLIVDTSNKYLIDRRIRQTIDIIPNKGPLGGLYTGLHNMRYSKGLLLSCDCPCLNRVLLKWMTEHLAGYDAIVPQLMTKNRTIEFAKLNQRRKYLLFPLHAVYHRRCISKINFQFKRNSLALIDLLDQINTHFIDGKIFRRVDPKLESLISINTQNDLKLLDSKLPTSKSPAFKAVVHPSSEG